MPKITPMMQQYLDIKDGCRDAILFYRMGDFYEMFYDDARVASRILGITLTSRERNKEDGVPMCGVPYHSASGYISRLIHCGKKVAVCEQGSVSRGAKGLVPREVVRIITPGLVVGDGHLDNDRPNYLLAVCRQGLKGLFGLAFIDISTGDFRVTQVENHEEFSGELGRIAPSEVIASEKGLVPDGLFTTMVDRIAGADDAAQVLTSHFNILGVEGLGLKGRIPALKAAAMILVYIRDTQKGVLPHLTGLRYYNPGQ
ncbi:MAG: DNA mismatch repair protein MutS, partial [Thermodesulfobacteriota bacterium]|nr:DNA mismatch repair protein MutS [Thermodesulfobacteriota bacterium]